MLRKTIATGTALLVSVLLLGCASTPADEPASSAATETPKATTTATTSSASAKSSAEAEPKVVQTMAQAEKVASEEEAKRAYRECMRKMRRITGSRIPRNACQGSTGLYSGAYNQPTEGQDGAPGLPPQ